MDIATRPHWWLVNTGSGNGLVLSGNKPLTEPMLTQNLDNVYWNLSYRMQSLCHDKKQLSLVAREREREIKFIGLFENRGHRGPYSSYKPFNHNLYICIIIFPHIDNPQYTDYDLPKKIPNKIISGGKMMSWNGNIFRVTGPLCGEFTIHWWIPCTKASDVELWSFLWSAPE